MKKLLLFFLSLFYLSVSAQTFNFTSTESQTIDDVTVTLGQGTGYAPEVTSNGVILRTGNTITVSGPGLRNINLSFSQNGIYNYASLKASNGTLISGGTPTSENDIRTDTWTGGTGSVTFTLGTVTRIIKQITVEDESNCELIDDLYYILDKQNKTAHVTFRYYNTSVNNYPNLSGNLIIPNTVVYNEETYSVTEIGNYAFSDCTGLTSVEIPNSVTSIWTSAFSNCTGLTSVKIPNSVTSIGTSAFSGCTGLTSVEIPNSVTSIGISAFSNCSGLKSVIIGNSVTTIGYSAFSGCTGLVKSAFPSTIRDPFNYGTHFQYPAEGSVVEDGFIWGPDRSAIYFAPLDLEGEYTIPNSVTTIGNYAFSRCTGLTSVIIPNSVTSIGEQAFSGCSAIKNVTFEDGEESVSLGSDWSSNCSIETLYLGRTISPSSAFSGNTTLTSVIIGDSVKTIGDSAFSGCSGLTSVTIGNSVTSIGTSAFSGCSGLTSVGIPNSVTSIGTSAFSGCSGLTSIEIPNSVTSIGTSAFSGCSAIKNVTFEDGEESVSLGINWSSNCPIETLYLGRTISSSSAFSGKTTLTSVIIGNSVTSIGNSAFSGCSSLTSIEIPNSVTTIENYAFYRCSGLTSVTIGNSVTSIGNYAFSGLSSLQKIISLAVTPPSISSNTFDSYAASLTIPDGTWVDYLQTLWANFENISDENGSEIRSFNDGVFSYRFNSGSKEAILIQNSNYASMTSAWIPDRVVVENDGVPAFYQVTGIVKNAFAGCSKLTQVNLPANCKFIGESAFNGCSGLKKVEISDIAAWCNIDFGSSNANPLYYAKKLYLNDSEIIELVIPDAVTSIGDYAFGNCSGLTSVEIPATVTSIGESAFSGCSGLKKVEISDLAAWCNIDFGVYLSGNTIYIGGNPLAMAGHLYINGEEVTDVTIPKTVKSIKPYAFVNFLALKNLTISNTVDTIGERAFEFCENIKSVTFEDGTGPLGIGELAFAGSVAPTDFYLGRSADGNLPQAANLTVGAFVTSLPENAYKGNVSLKTLVIKNGVLRSIGASAFQGCSNLSTVTFPENAIAIGDNAFNGTALTEVVLPAGTLGANAFAANKLKNITLGAGIETLGEMAFDGNNSISNVYSTRTTPPAAQNNSFSYYQAQLWVPEEAIDTYYNNFNCWYRFKGKPMVLAQNIEMDKDVEYSCEPGTTFQLSATISPANVTLDRILWHSTNPTIASVDNDGLVTIHNFDASSDELATLDIEDKKTCQIIASTLYENGPLASLTITVNDGSPASISDVNVFAPERPNDIYNLQGVMLKRNASQEDVDALAPGFYIIGGKKVLVK